MAKSQAAECYVKLSKYDEAVRLYEDIIRVNGVTSDYGKYSKTKDRSNPFVAEGSMSMKRRN